MKLRQIVPKKKLRATASARGHGSHVLEDEDEVPTMRLSNAFIIVLLLHFVAFGGIYTFGQIKRHQNDGLPSVKETAKETAKETTKATEKTAVATTPAVATTTIASTTTKPAVQESKKEVAAAAPATPKATAPAKPTSIPSVHVVVKGENPLLIAKRYGVNYDELLKVNKIDDPRKLRIGQKLTLPKPK